MEHHHGSHCFYSYTGRWPCSSRSSPRSSADVLQHLRWPGSSDQTTRPLTECPWHAASAACSRAALPIKRTAFATLGYTFSAIDGAARLLDCSRVDNPMSSACRRCAKLVPIYRLWKHVLFSLTSLASDRESEPPPHTRAGTGENGIPRLPPFHQRKGPSSFQPKNKDTTITAHISCGAGAPSRKAGYGSPALEKIQQQRVTVSLSR